MDTQQQPVVLPADKPKRKRGESAAHIRALYDAHPSMPQSVIARKVGCGQDHVAHVIKRYVKSCSLEELEDFRANKVDIFEAIQHQTLASITPEHFANASFQQLVTGAAILQDKIQLMSGLPTSIHVTALIDIASALREKERGE